MKISIVICTYNREKILKKVLEKLAVLNNIQNHEVLVIDNNSTDTTRETVREFININETLCVAYIIETQQGLSYARNAGIEHSTGDIIAFLDDDAFPCVDWLDKILYAFTQYDEAIAIGGEIIGFYETEKPSWIDHDIECLFSLLDLGDEEKELIDAEPVGANVAFRKK